MNQTFLRRSVGGSAVAALVLTAAPVVVGTQAAYAAPCNYPDSIPTSTSLTLTRSVAQYTVSNRANVKVSAGSGTPAGQVRINVDGVLRATITLNGSSAGSAALPRLKARATHLVEAVYVANCDHKTSSARKFVSVVRATTKAKPKVVKAKKAVFKATVTATASGARATSGRVVFTVRKANGQKVRTGIKRVRKGVAKVNLKDLAKGRYTVRIKYHGAPNFKPAKKKVKKFRVR